jgi:CRP/FNR family transcriptional regulator, cyclic AMP receptor protein
LVNISGFFGSAKQKISVPAGTEVFHEGDAGTSMYGVVEGEIELRTQNRVIATVGVNEVFGEMALVDHSPRMATAVATTDAVLAEIDQYTFLFLIHETPTFALTVMSAMADRFRVHASELAGPT